MGDDCAVTKLALIPHSLNTRTVVAEVAPLDKVAHAGGASPGFCSVKQLGVLLLPPEWDASLSHGYPPAGV